MQAVLDTQGHVSEEMYTMNIKFNELDGPILEYVLMSLIMKDKTLINERINSNRTISPRELIGGFNRWIPECIQNEHISVYYRPADDGFAACHNNNKYNHLGEFIVGSDGKNQSEDSGLSVLRAFVHKKLGNTVKIPLEHYNFLTSEK